MDKKRIYMVKRGNVPAELFPGLELSAPAVLVLESEGGTWTTAYACHDPAITEVYLRELLSTHIVETFLDDSEYFPERHV